MVIPQRDVERVRSWAEEKTPPEFRGEMRIEVDETPRGLTILECRPPWGNMGGSDWTRMPIARLGYVQVRTEWALCWVDRNERFHRYDLVATTPNVVELLDEIDADPTCIFWG